MYNTLREINTKPEPFQYYTAFELWTDEHTSQKMLEYHLDPSIDAASRNTAFIDRSVRWIISRFGIGEGSNIVDFGCGPGLYASRFAAAGARVTGIDFSRRSIEYAEREAVKKGLTIDYACLDYLDFVSADTFDLITMIMCDFSALGPAQRKKLLASFRGLLKPGGSVLMDVYSYNFFNGTREASSYGRNLLNRFWSPEEYFCFMNTFRYEDERLVLDKYTIVEEKTVRVVYNWLQCFSEESIRKEFAESGLEIGELYSDVAGAPFSGESDVFAVTAGKRQDMPPCGPR